MPASSRKPIMALEWKSNSLVMLDQKLLPIQENYLVLNHWEAVRDAIQNMTVRGAPAIGVAAAYGMALAAKNGDNWEFARQGLAESRPTAVNLFWALARLDQLEDKSFESVLAEAHAIAQEDLAMNQTIGDLGSELVPPDARILTICNTGSLATSGHGTALGIIRSAFQKGRVKHVYSCETRPRQQGMRLTAWELLNDGIPFYSIADSASACLMQDCKVDLIVVGADRIAANGDTANKIGTYMLAVLAKHHGIPFVVAAPSSTLDPETLTGGDIPIEERDASELTHCEGVQVAPTDCPVFNPAFDVTPGDLITAIVTENAVFTRPYQFLSNMD